LKEQHQYEPKTEAVRTLQVVDIFARTTEAFRDQACFGLVSVELVGDCFSSRFRAK
jgi:hypothetical protein